MKFDFRFMRLLPKPISLEKIEAFLKDEGTKRIHFATTHSKSLKEGNKQNHGKISLPFNQTIGPILSYRFENGMSDYLFHSKFDTGGYWRSFKTEDDFSRCKQFTEEYSEIVFLRDTLDLSLALSMNYQDDEHTEIGDLEYKAKFQKCQKSENSLVKLIQHWIARIPYYSTADAICAMPCTDPAKPSLPRRIVDNIPEIENISSSVKWKNKDKSLKELSSVEEKIEALKSFEIEITSDLKGKNVILLDDLYMSGISMQFVAMKLKEAGVKRIFGISIVKSRSNTAL